MLIGSEWVCLPACQRDLPLRARPKRRRRCALPRALQNTVVLRTPGEIAWSPGFSRSGPPEAGTPCEGSVVARERKKASLLQRVFADGTGWGLSRCDRLVPCPAVQRTHAERPSAKPRCHCQPRPLDADGAVAARQPPPPHLKRMAVRFALPSEFSRRRLVRVQTRFTGSMSTVSRTSSGSDSVFSTVARRRVRVGILPVRRRIW